MKTTPRKGDYIRASGVTVVQYHAVCKILIDAGFGVGEYPHPYFDKITAFGISSKTNCIFHAKNELYDVTFNGRKLSLSDLLGDELPGEDSPTWNGCGNPLNGTECEVSTYDKDTWLGCTVLFIGSQHCVLQYPGREEAYHLKHIKFRPLKSERELAIDHMEVLRLKWVENSTLPEDLFGLIYDAGYRRVEK